jgi:hypothetical protein
MVPVRKVGGGIAKIGSAVAGKGMAVAGKVQNSKAGKFVSGGLSRVGDTGGRLVARVKQNDGVGAVVIDTVPEMAASMAQGVVNASKVGKAIKEKIFLDASTVGLIFGAVVRFFKLDAKHPKIRAGNTAQMKAEITVLGRTFGTRVPGAFQAFLAPDGGTGSAIKKLAVGAVKPNNEERSDPAGDEASPVPAAVQGEIPEA